MTAANLPVMPEHADPRRWIALVILLLANVMNLMDVTIVIIGLPTIQRSLHATPSELEWVVAAYVIALALGLLPFGRLGDILGRKRVFLWGVIGFSLASLLCGIAPTVGTLIAARAIQGLAAAMMGPQVLAIIHVIFPPEEKGRAFSLFALSTGLASVLGSIAGGVLIAANVGDLEWRPIFLVNIPVGLLAAIAGRAVIVAVPGHPLLRNDWLGIAIFSLTVLLLIFPLIEGRSYDWPLWVSGMVTASPVAAWAFYSWERRRYEQQRPQLLPLSLLVSGTFQLGATMALLYFSAIPGMFFMFAVFVQTGYGLSPLPAGLVGVPFPIGLVIASILSGRLGNRHLLPRLVIGSFTLAIGVLALRLTVGQVGKSLVVWAFLPSFLIAGAGMGTSVGPLFQTVLSGVPRDDAGAAAGALQAVQQIGAAFGIAVVGGIFFAVLEAATASRAVRHAAYVSAAGDALNYEIAVFLIVAAMALLLRRLNEVMPTYKASA